MSKYDSFGSGTLVGKEALTEFKKKYDENIIHSAEEVFEIAAATKDEKSPFMVGSKAFHEMTGGISFGKDEDGKFGYIIGDRGIVIPFGSNGFDGYQGIIWGCGYTTAYIGTNTPPGFTMVSNMKDVMESSIWSDRYKYQYHAFYIYEPCRIRFRAFSNYGLGNNSKIKTTFTIYDTNTMNTMEYNKSLNDIIVKFEGHEMIRMEDNLKCSITLEENDKYEFFGGWMMEILSLDDDYVYKPTYMHSSHINGDGKNWDFHKDYGDKTMRYDATTLDRGMRGFAICAGGSVGGGTWMDNYKAAGGVSSFGRGELTEIMLDDHLVVTCRYKNNEPTASALLVFSMPSEQLIDKEVKLIKHVSVWRENYWGDNTTKSKTETWTVDGIREGHNGFCIWYGRGGVTINGVALSSTKSKIIKNGDVISVTCSAPRSSSSVAAACIIEI